MATRPTWMGPRDAAAGLEGAPAWWGAQPQSAQQGGNRPSLDPAHGHGACCQPVGQLPKACDIPKHLQELIAEGVISERQATVITEREKEYAESDDPVFRAASRGHLVQLMEVLSPEEVAAAVDENGRSVLHYAAENGNVGMIQWLADNDADVAGQDPTARNCTPLHTAAAGGHDRAIQELADRKADVQAVDAEGQTALHAACIAGSIECAALLIALGGHVDAADDVGTTPLMCVFATQETSERTVTQLAALLVEMGAGVNRQDADGNSALHHASATLRLGAVKLLENAGANLQQENSKAEQPLDVLGRGVHTRHPSERRRGAMILARLTPRRNLRGVERLFGLWATPQGITSTRNIAFFLPLVWLALAGYFGEVVGPILFGSDHFDYLAVTRLGAVFFIIAMTIQIFNVIWTLIGQHMAFVMNGLVWGQCILMYITVLVWFAPRISTPSSPVDASEQIGGPFVILLIAIGTVVLFRSAYMVKKYEKENIVRGASDDRDRRELILRMSREDKLKTANFDFTSFAERPMRSKHAEYLPAWGPAVVRSELYARFDHYCPFSDCVVGQRNHVFFFQYVMAIVGMSILFVYLSVKFVIRDCPIEGNHSMIYSIFRWLVCRPWVTWVGGNAALHATWASCLFFDQLYMAVIEDLTTNEKINSQRHPYNTYIQRSKYGSFSPSPWSLGPAGNFARLVGGMQTPDYRRVFSMQPKGDGWV